MISFEIPGKPLGKQRPRFGKGFTYTPKETTNYETLVRQIYITSKYPKLEGYITANIKAYYEIPQSASKTKQKQMLEGKIRPDKKPDLDNIAKIICDSLNGIAYSDDKQIISLTIEKFYAEDPKVKIELIGG